MSYSVEYIDTDFSTDPVVHAIFFKRFSETTDSDGTPLPDLYADPCTILTARGAAPFAHNHGWVPEDEDVPRLAAVYHPWADRFDVISFVIQDVKSATEIELALFDIFTLGPNGFGYMIESEGIPFDLVMDFSTNHFDGDYPVLTLHAQDHGQPIDMVMRWAWAMIGSVVTEQTPKSLAN